MKKSLASLIGAVVIPFRVWGQTSFIMGTYDGSNSSKSIAGLGFMPELVIIQCYTSGEECFMATSTMTSGYAKDVTSADVVTTGYITSLDADGFTLPGNVLAANRSGYSYQFTAFDAGSDMVVGSYTGSSGTDNRNITGIGFQPEMVFVFPENAVGAFHRPSSLAGDAAFNFATEGIAANYIQSFLADGFQVGSALNTNAIKYHYVAFNAVASNFAVGSYTGDDSDNRNYTGVGFETKFAMTTTDGSGAYRNLAVSGDISFEFEFGAYASNYIQSLTATGFQLGSDGQVNSGGDTYYWAVFGGSYGILPITLLKFDAEMIKNKVRLSWTTATEINNDFYTLEKSRDGVNFEAFAKVKGAGNSNEQRSYEIADEKPYSGTSYYRLKQTDYDGKFEYFPLKTVSADESSLLFDFYIFPNPLTGTGINISVNGEKDKELLVVVQDLWGRLYYSKVFLLHGQETLVLDTHDNPLPPGIYYVIASSDDTMISRKLVIR